MPIEPPPPKDQRGGAKPAEDTPRWQASMALSIPTLMVSGPLVGYFLGGWLQRRFGWPDWTVGAMVLLGLVAGLRESYKVIRKIAKS